MITKDIYEIKQLRLVISSYDNTSLGFIDIFDFDFKNCTTTVVQELDVPFEILKFAREKEAQVMAIAPHDRHGLFYALTKQISKELVNHSPIPIWSKSIK